MGCITCSGGRGSDGAPMSNITFQEDANRLFHTGDFMLVTYRGPSYPHPVGSPTNVLLTQYGYTVYSKHSQGGRSLLVHVNDLATRPDIFVAISEGTDAYTAALEQFNIDPDDVPAEPVVEVPMLDEDLNVVDDVPVDVGESESDEGDNDEDVFPRLTRETAMTLSEFTQKHPDFEHHAQVLAKVRVGVLQSEKRELDGKKVVYVWHTEEVD